MSIIKKPSRRSRATIKFKSRVPNTHVFIILIQDDLLLVTLIAWNTMYTKYK